MPVPEDKLRLGGMALRNGLLVHGPTHWAAAVRAKQGNVKVASGPKPRFTATDKIPGLRGLARLAESFVVIPLVSRGLPDARLPFESPSVLGVAAGASLAGTLLRRRAPRPRRAAAALIAMAPALFALRGGELAAYHGVEHKSIAAYESGDEDAADATKEHERCGSHLMAPMMVANLAGTLLLKRVLERPSRSPAAPSRSPRPRWRSRCSAGPSAMPTRRWPARSSARATRSSASSGRASPTSASWRSAAPRWRRSCASRMAVSTPG